MISVTPHTPLTTFHINKTTKLVIFCTYNHYLMISAQYGTPLEESYSHHNGLFTLSPPSVLEMVVYYLHISKLEAVIVDLCRQVLPGCFMGSDYYHILKMAS